MGENRFQRALEAFGGVTFLEGNSVERLRNGVEIFPAMLDAISKAEHRIDFITFVYWTGEIANKLSDALAERATAGVEVRVLLDAVGARLMKAELVEKMERAGAQIAWFRPVTRWKVWETDHRTHRKILVIDDEVAFTGGVGIASEWEGDARNDSEWRDSHFAVRGPAVDPLRAAFATDWRDAEELLFEHDRIPQRPPRTGDVRLGVVDSPAQIELSKAGLVFETIVQMAQHRLWITTPYFNPSERLAKCLIDAAERGVEVRLMIPGPHIDKRVSLVSAEDQAATMMKSGVTLHRYQPTMLHLKQLVADDSLSIFGSVNVNERSFYKDEEVAVVAVDRRLNELLASDFLADLDHCDTVDDPSALGHTLAETALAKLTKPFQGEM